MMWASLLVTISRFGLWVGEWKRRMKGVVFDDDGGCKIKRRILVHNSPLYTSISELIKLVTPT